MHRLFTLASLSGLLRIAQTLTLNVATSGGNASSPILYGLLFEVRCIVQLDVISKTNGFKDVYHSGDGGLYSEMIQNRAFQGTVNQNSDGSAAPPFQTLQYWHTSGSDTLTLDNEALLLTSALP